LWPRSLSITDKVPPCMTSNMAAIATICICLTAGNFVRWNSVWESLYKYVYVP
jgi:hypothetical protein